MTSAGHIADEIARWMLAKLENDGGLYQDILVSEISDRFGDDFVTINTNGNPSIGRSVLAAFNKLTENTVVWVRSERMWRKREDYDEPGRQQP